MTEELAQQEHQAALLEHNNLLTQVKRLTKIEDADQYRLVAAWNATFKKGIAYFEERWRPHIRAADEQHSNLLADLKRDQAPSREGSAIAGRLLSNYDTRQEEARQQEQRRLEQEAEDDKKRLAQIARDAGEKKLANEILKRPAEPVVAEKKVPKVDGLHFTERKDYEIVNTEALMKLVLAGKIPVSEIVIEFNWKFIQKQMTQLFDSCKPDEAADKLGIPTNGARWLYRNAVKIWETKGTVQKG